MTNTANRSPYNAGLDITPAEAAAIAAQSGPGVGGTLNPDPSANRSQYAALVERASIAAGCAAGTANDVITWPSKHCVPGKAPDLAGGLAYCADVLSDCASAISALEQQNEKLEAAAREGWCPFEEENLDLKNRNDELEGQRTAVLALANRYEDSQGAMLFLIVIADEIRAIYPTPPTKEE